MSWRRLLSAKVSGLQSSGHNSCDSSLSVDLPPDCLSAKERFLYFSGRRDAPSSDRFHCRLTSVTPVLTLSVRNPILVQPGGRDGGGGRAGAGFQTRPNFAEAPGLHRAPCRRPTAPGPRGRWSLTSRSIPTLRLDCTGSLSYSNYCGQASSGPRWKVGGRAAGGSAGPGAREVSRPARPGMSPSSPAPSSCLRSHLPYPTPVPTAPREGDPAGRAPSSRHLLLP